MKRREVFMEQKDGSKLVGTITGNHPQEACFAYAPSYMDDHDAAAISVSLPLQEEPFSPDKTRCFFDGLLPEGYTRQSVAGALHADASDYLSILSALGRECIGALRIVTDQAPAPASSYEALSASRMQELAAGDASYTASMMTDSRLSLAGASGKVGLYYDEASDKWYLPHGLAASTHIVKQSHVRLSKIVLNEQLCMLTAANMGIDTPRSFIVDKVHGKRVSPLFATKRFDRVMPAVEKEGDRLPSPYRLHQEDFAQALGIPSENKYEPEGASYLKRMTELVRKVSADPVADLERLWERIVFHCMVGNADAHLKNYSLLYNADMKEIRLTPSYDIVSTIVYDETTRDMSFQIGGVRDLRKIDKDALLFAAKETGISSTFMETVIKRMTAAFEDALLDAERTLADQGHADVNEIAGKILRFWRQSRLRAFYEGR